MAPEPNDGSSTGEDGSRAPQAGDTVESPPESVVDEAVRLSRLARDAVDGAEAEAYRQDRDELLADYGFETRVREDDDRAVLACYPTEWVVEGTVRMDRVEDVSRGVERPLEGPGLGDDWEAVATHNEELAAAVRAEHGDVHGETATALADFASNHYAKRLDRLTAAELAEFREEYFPRNAWPTDDQRAALDRSIRLTYEVADVRVPGGE